jgi:uncharacterized protein with ParB-like and HNH nuclease domain
MLGLDLDLRVLDLDTFTMLKAADFHLEKKVDNWVPALSIEHYFTQDFALSIPPWQREYTWDSSDADGQVPVLLEDLRNFYLNKGKEEYLIGAVILCDTNDEKNKHLIDGQQRSLTLYLLLMCCEKYLRKNRIYSAGDYLFQTRLHNVINASEMGFTARVTFNQEKANAIMVKIHDWAKADSPEADAWLKEIDSYSQTQKNLLTVVQFFYKQLEEGKWIEKSELIQAIDKIIKGVKVIQLVLDNQSEAIEVFDRINHRGMQLSGADLIKNQIFQMVTDEKFEEISVNWQAMVETLRKNTSAKLQDPKYLLRAHAWTLWPTKTTYDELADKYVKIYFQEDKNDAAKFSDDLKKYADTLGDYSQLKHSKFGNLPELMPSKFLGSVQHYPVLLAGASIASKESFLHLYRQVSARTALYVLSQERPPNFESIIPEWANSVREAGEDVSIQELDAIFKGKPSFPDEMVDQMRRNISNWRYGNSADRKKIRTAISYMSWAMDSLIDRHFEVTEYFETRKPKGKAFGWDIDHVEPTASKTNTLSPEFKDSIGNLVLLSPKDNRAAKNADAFEKTPYYVNSLLYMTKMMVNEPITPKVDKVLLGLLEKLDVTPEWKLDNWDDACVASRASFYTEFLTQLVTLKITIPIDKFKA